MNKKTALKVLKTFYDLERSKTELFRTSPFVFWDKGKKKIKIEGDFSVEQLEAIAHWIRTHS